MNEKSNSPKLLLALLFGISLVYFTFFGNGVFLYQENRSLFIFSGAYLREFLGFPGGLSEYIGNFIQQGYYSSLYGALVLSLFLLLFAACLGGMYKAMSGNKGVPLPLILAPSCLLLLMQMQSDHTLHHSLGYVFVAGFTCLSLYFRRKRLSFLIPLLFPAFVHLTGSYSLVFLAIFIVYCLLHKKGRARYTLPGILIILAFLSMMGLEGYLLHHPPEHYMGQPLPFHRPEHLRAGDVILCTYLILFPLMVRVAGSTRSPALKTERATDGISYVLLLITAIVLGALYDPEFAKLSRIERHFLRQEWEQVIEAHEKAPSDLIAGTYYYNLALSENGQLCNRMFHGLQESGEHSLLIHSSQDNIVRSMYYYYTLGFMNEAHHLAYESMVLNGYRPENIKMLIKTDLINGDHRSAERHIALLKKTLPYRKWAEKHERMLHKPERVLADPELGAKSKLLPRKDFFITPSDVLNIDLMLMSNPENKIAFEYKLACLLLEKDFKSVVYQVKKMQNMDYDCLPQHIEEAIIFFIRQNHELPYLGGFEPGPELRKHFDQFISATKTNDPGMDPSIQKTWGNTYWYYHAYK